MEKKKFVLKIRGEVFETNAVAVSVDAEILFEGDINAEVPADVQAQLDLQNANVDKEAQIKEAHETLIEDIYSEMENVFGTRNDASAQAFASTFQAMISRPLNYIDADLGLNTEDDVLQYAATKINASDAYGVFRLKRIAQYKAAQAEILGE